MSLFYVTHFAMQPDITTCQDRDLLVVYLCKHIQLFHSKTGYQTDREHMNLAHYQKFYDDEECSQCKKRECRRARESDPMKSENTFAGDKSSTKQDPANPLEMSLVIKTASESGNISIAPNQREVGSERDIFSKSFNCSLFGPSFSHLCPQNNRLQDQSPEPCLSTFISTVPGFNSDGPSLKVPAGLTIENRDGVLHYHVSPTPVDSSARRGYNPHHGFDTGRLPPGWEPQDAHHCLDVGRSELTPASTSEASNIPVPCISLYVSAGTRTEVRNGVTHYFPSTSLQVDTPIANIARRYNPEHGFDTGPTPPGWGLPPGVTSMYGVSDALNNRGPELDDTPLNSSQAKGKEVRDVLADYVPLPSPREVRDLHGNPIPSRDIDDLSTEYYKRTFSTTNSNLGSDSYTLISSKVRRITDFKVPTKLERYHLGVSVIRASTNLTGLNTWEVMDPESGTRLDLSTYETDEFTINGFYEYVDIVEREKIEQRMILRREVEKEFEQYHSGSLYEEDLFRDYRKNDNLAQGSPAVNKAKTRDQHIDDALFSKPERSGSFGTDDEYEDSIAYDEEEEDEEAPLLPSPKLQDGSASGNQSTDDGVSAEQEQVSELANASELLEQQEMAGTELEKAAGKKQQPRDVTLMAGSLEAKASTSAKPHNTTQIPVEQSSTPTTEPELTNARLTAVPKVEPGTEAGKANTIPKLATSPANTISEDNPDAGEYTDAAEIAQVTTLVKFGDSGTISTTNVRETMEDWEVLSDSKEAKGKNVV